MALVSLGGPSFEVSLLNLDTGDIEIMMTVNEANSQSSDNQIGITPIISQRFIDKRQLFMA